MASRAWLAVPAMLAVGTLGCGTRVAGGPSTLVTSTTTNGATALPASAPALPAASTTYADSPLSATTKASAALPKQPTGPDAAPAAPLPSGQVPGGGVPAVAPAAPRPGSAAPASTPGAATPGVPATAAAEPLILGNIGTFSGPLGSTFNGSIAGTQAWARWINGRGGLGGHPVRVLSVDDGADPARSKANLKDLIEQRGVVAILGDYSVVTRSGHSDYILEKRVPVIGGDQGTPEWVRNPMYFGAGPNAQTLIYGAVTEGARVGKKRLAFVYCAEIADCKGASLMGREAARDNGMTVVYEASVSVAQPDYTAECLQAQRAQADVVYFLADTNSFSRFSRSCSRQGYTPLYVNASAQQDENVPRYEGLGGGLRGVQPQIPWFVRSGTPAIEEYAAALDQYAKGAKRGQDVMTGWTSGKILETALTRRALASRISSDDILRALWTIKDETFGRLVPPTTYVENRPGSPGHCWFVTAVVNGAWTTPGGLTPSCVDKVLDQKS